MNHLTSAKLFLKKEATLNLTSSHNAIPHNARISTQRYHSTRRKRQRRSVHTLLKPTDEEVKRIRLEMSNTCSVCFQEDPAEIHEHTQQQETGEDGDEEVMWVQCSHCCLWFHLVCVGDIALKTLCFVCKRTQQ